MHESSKSGNGGLDEEDHRPVFHSAWVYIGLLKRPEVRARLWWSPKVKDASKENRQDVRRCEGQIVRNRLAIGLRSLRQPDVKALAIRILHEQVCGFGKHTVGGSVHQVGCVRHILERCATANIQAQRVAARHAQSQHHACQ